MATNPTKRARTDDPVEAAQMQCFVTPLLEYLATDRAPIPDDEALLASVGIEGPQFDEDWTHEDEQRLMVEWRTMTEYTAMQALPRLHEPLRDVWRIAVHVMHRTPIGIISLDARLCYGDVSSPSWTPSFCVALGKLMLHPFWRYDYKELVRAVQFAVACRTGERGAWFFLPDKTCSYRVSMSIAFAAAHDPRTACQVVDDIIQEQTPPSEVLFFSHLGAYIAQQHRPAAPTGEAHAHMRNLHVRTEDLENIARALNTFRPAGVPLAAHTDLYHAAYLSSLDVQPPFSDDRIREMHEVAWLEQLRIVVMYERLLGEQAEADDAGPGVDEDLVRATDALLGLPSEEAPAAPLDTDAGAPVVQQNRARAPSWLTEEVQYMPRHRQHNVDQDYYDD
ncbi:hypothetical protein JDV02_009912 [Purpureocillium takamizusanense]|uniref:Uncharacterized protein n=1 Tax=Purpureocillium takamizusanense TaxID=2060973 RepID=A0A9Q8VGQ5_9HYPO|nr:uncharacterized protein JDV02_009912 [Purpureocillium takamizusanense]UNI24139.1 hypothetical protein JDV02_009912 [Purpureocillium takamizusanense]